jgi:uncharacterized protein
MSLIGEQILLRIYLDSADRAPRLPTYERIVKAARNEKMAGATVLRGLAASTGFQVVEHVPIIVEIVDGADKILHFLGGPLSRIMTGGMLTLERAAVMMYRQRELDQPGSLQLAAALKPLSTLPQFEPGANMTRQDNGVLLRVFIGDSDRFEHQPLYEAIVRKARQLGLAGATVLRGSEGFGAHSVVHKASLLEMSADLPIVVEIVDSEEKINLLLPHLEAMVKEGMITMEYVVIVMVKHSA